MASRLIILLLLAALPAQATEPMVGPAVGNADTLVSEGSKLFNRSSTPRPPSSSSRRRAPTRPTWAPTCSWRAPTCSPSSCSRACYAYRVYLKAVARHPRPQEGLRRERPVRAAAQGRAQRSPTIRRRGYVDSAPPSSPRSTRRSCWGPGAASETLRAPGEATASSGPSWATWPRSWAPRPSPRPTPCTSARSTSEPLTAEELRSARPLYQVASDVGTSPPDAKARIAFLDGLAALTERDFQKAEASSPTLPGATPRTRSTRSTGP